MAGEHAGHRRRLFARLKAEGLGGFQPHEVVELLLCYAIPVRDVNELAHRLVGRFGSVDGALAAPAEQVMEVPGAGRRVAELLGAVREAMEGYLSAAPIDRPRLSELKRMVGYGRAHFAPVGRPAQAMACLGAEGQLQNLTPLPSLDPSGGELRLAAEAALKYRAYSVVLLTFSPLGAPAFDGRALAFARLCADLMAELDVSLLDLVAITPDGHLSLRRLGPPRGMLPALREPVHPLLWMREWLGPDS
ncbi:MAG: hypothetical protein GX558_02865 [Clostridiales bacterium]|nr:hypothetical protein [Clostridiales bacterium]